MGTPELPGGAEFGEGGDVGAPVAHEAAHVLHCPLSTVKERQLRLFLCLKCGGLVFEGNRFVVKPMLPCVRAAHAGEGVLVGASDDYGVAVGTGGCVPSGVCVYINHRGLEQPRLLPKDASSTRTVPPTLLVQPLSHSCSSKRTETALELW